MAEESELQAVNTTSSASTSSSPSKTEQSQESMENRSSKLNIAIIHPDLGIGGAERLIVDAAVQLASQGHNVHIFTSHHDKNRCFEETLSGTFPVTVYGAFLPRHIFYRFHAVCAYLRCLFVALCVLLMWPSFDCILADQVSVVVPLMKTKKSRVVFYCHFPDLLLAKHTTSLRRIYRKPIDMLEEVTTGMADLVVVNSRFTASTFAKTFKRLDSQGIKPAVLYPAVNLEQFDEPSAYNLNFLSINRFERKKNIALAISSFAMLRVHEKDVLQGQGLAKISLTIAGGFDSHLRENVEYLEELKSLADKEGVSDMVNFITSCSTTERNDLLSQCLCVLYTPEVLSMSRRGGAGAVAQLVADVPLSSVEGGGGEGGDNQTAISLKRAKGGEAKRIKGSSKKEKSNGFKWGNRKDKNSKAPKVHGMLDEDAAATKIQTAYRGYKARKTLRRLKGVVRFKDLALGNTVTKQTSIASNYIHTWSKLQNQIRARRQGMVIEGRIRQKKLENQLKLETKLHDLEVEWCGGSDTMEDILARIQQREEAAVKRERAMAYAFSHQWRANTGQNPGRLSYELGKANWGWSWMERWIAARPWENRLPVPSTSPKKVPTKQVSKVVKNASSPAKKVSVKTALSNGKGSANVKSVSVSPPKSKDTSIKQEQLVI